MNIVGEESEVPRLGSGRDPELVEGSKDEACLPCTISVQSLKALHHIGTGQAGFMFLARFSFAIKA